MYIFASRSVKKSSILFFVICLLLSSLFSSAQNFEEKGYWTELMRYYILPVDSIWLFHAGSEKPSELNDTNWISANTELLTNAMGQPLPGRGFGWYKKTFEMPPALRGKPISFRMGHFGASEVFLDGKLVQRYGEVAGDEQVEKIFVPRVPWTVFPDNQQTHTLLVFYSNMHAGLPYYGNKHIGFRLLIATTDVFPQHESSDIGILPISVCIMFIFSLFFFFVYLFYPNRLASLFTAILLLNFSALFVGIYFTITKSEWEPLRKAALFVQIESVWNILLQLLVLYALYYNGKLRYRFPVVMGAMVICVFVSFYPQLGMLIPPILLLAYFDMYRLLILGIRNKKSGFWILLVGTMIQHGGFFIIVQDIFHLFPKLTPGVLLITMIFPQLGVPLTYALQFAWEFGRANRDLRLQLAQVKTLSETTLRQEQEKQEMLTQQKEKLEIMVTDRTRELSNQKETLQNTLINLESTQAQLIQSEKMASLGELTAGIAHEIQNPLNFVNNFSEVNRELLQEMKTELMQGNNQDAISIADNVIANEEKINRHGQRADAIVKGMLQHSRTDTGVKEPTNINALADEYMRLSYHGLRAREKSFNATLNTNVDQHIGLINIIPQDIGRMLLNLFNNAFYAVSGKKKTAPAGYEPTVTLTTKKVNNKVEIRVWDNGSGIPARIKDKIFQPFFTTKPTGQGTGLGLSLNYDIIKAHGGEISVDSKEGEFTEFVVMIPMG